LTRSMPRKDQMYNLVKISKPAPMYRDLPEMQERASRCCSSI
jgi:hypothetical protein